MESSVVGIWFPESMPHALILLSPLATQGGNFVTINRIRSHLEGEGFTCHLEDPSGFGAGGGEFEHRVVPDDVGVLVGIHALRTGTFMRGQNLPYILIMGGTDIHEFCHDTQAMMAMSEAVHKARFVVCFSEANKDRTQVLWPDIDASRLKVIPQAVQTAPSEAQLKDYIPHFKLCGNVHNSSYPHPGLVGSVLPCQEKLLVFIFVGGIRAVKNPLFLVPTFQEWHARDRRIVYLMLGPRLETKFACDIFEPAVKSLPGVLYVPGLPISDVHSLVTQATALVNTSDSEGMCLAVLEAMQLCTPVLARDVPGNRAIVKHGDTGLLFDSPQSFLQQAQSLLASPDLRSRITREARAYICRHHNLDTERADYSRLLQQCLRDLHQQRCVTQSRIGFSMKHGRTSPPSTGVGALVLGAGPWVLESRSSHLAPYRFGRRPNLKYSAPRYRRKYRVFHETKKHSANETFIWETVSSNNISIQTCL
ncbi:hypothetical protein EGW08_002486 [Elysia chlorotica]|uniref:Glycosyl transferase family 1 domain-containing protein n=1 Tax=Elysia chlorotica TaxID=188477 RepID=A0A433U7J6_ELYCH|nr:hypothetical protein EGW08_002486 [Elysia chlorotica]